MIAQRTRLEAIAANLANKDAILDASGKVNPYRARKVLFAPGDPGARTAEGRAMGVHVAQIQIDQNAVRWKHDPGNPYAVALSPATIKKIGAIHDAIEDDGVDEVID